MKVRITALGVTGACMAALGLAAVAPPATGSDDQGASRIGHIRLDQTRVMYDRGVSPNITGTPRSQRAAPHIPTFHRTVRDGATTFPYTMVGKDPFKNLANGVTRVKTVLVPIIVKLSNGDTFDPTRADSCAPSSSVRRTQISPVFGSRPYSFGGTRVGTGQFVSIFRRAEFYPRTRPGGVNPDYQVTLTKNKLAPITVHVPDASAAEGTLSCGPFGAMEIGWWDRYVQRTLMPKLANHGYGSNTFPIFLLSNVVEFIGTTSNCCVLGYHNAFTNPADHGTTTYSTSMYDNTHNFFPGVRDISVLTHEVAEWMDDPLVDGVNNNTKPWGHIGQVTGCQSNLEVGDPLSGTTQTVTLHGKTWHPQELAFFSWFYHQNPSLGVNGWFSSNRTFTADAIPCH